MMSFRGWRPGQRPDAPVEIGDSSRFEVELAVDETDIALLHTGQPVVYAIDAYRDSVFQWCHL